MWRLHLFVPCAKKRVRSAVAGGVATPQDGDDVEEDPEDALPRADIAAKITAQLIGNLGEKNWKLRAEAIAQLHEILHQAGDRIAPQLGDLPPALARRLVDPNKNIAVSALKVVATLVSGLGKGADKFAKIFVEKTFSSMCDNKAHVRSAAVAALDALFSNCSPESVAPCATVCLKNEGAGRKECVQWLSSKLTESDDMPENVFCSLCRACDALLPHLLQCLLDKNTDVRKCADGCLTEILGVVGASKLRSLTDRIPKASQIAIQPYLQAYQTLKRVPKKPRQQKQPQKTNPDPAPPASLQNEDPVCMEAAAVPVAKSDAKEAMPETAASGDETSHSLPEKPVGSKLQSPAPKKALKRPKTPMRKRTSSISASAKPEEPTSSEPDLISNTQRLQRLQSAAEWIVDETTQKLRIDAISSLSLQTQSCMSERLNKLMFSGSTADQLEAARILDEACRSSEMSLVLCNLDLLLRWVGYRLLECGSQPSYVKRTLRLLDAILKPCQEETVLLHDLEAQAVLPQIIEGLGSNSEAVRSDFDRVYSDFRLVYPPSKIMPMLLRGLGSSSPMTRAACISKLAKEMELHPPTARLLAELSRFVGDKDHKCSDAALNALCRAKQVLGEDKFLEKIGSSLTEQQASLLERRLRFGSDEAPLTPQGRQILQRAATPTRERSESRGRSVTPCRSRSVSRGRSVTPSRDRSLSRGRSVTPSRDRSLSRGRSVT
eukprot:Rmarinus@m.24855